MSENLDLINMPYACGKSTIMLNGHQYIIVSGGWDGRNKLSSVAYLDLEDPASGWQKDFPDMPEVRWAHAQRTVEVNGHQYIIVSGGVDGNKNILSSVIYLDVNNLDAGWQSFPDMQEGRYDHDMYLTFHNNSKIYIMLADGIDDNNEILSSTIYLDVDNPTAGWKPS